MIGLSTKSDSEHYKDINFALYMRVPEKDVEVWELGTSRGKFGKFSKDSVGKVAINAQGEIAYSVDGEIRYTSRVAPVYPLFVDTSFKVVGAQLKNVTWVGGAASTAALQVGGNIHFTAFKVRLITEHWMLVARRWYFINCCYHHSGAE